MGGCAEGSGRLRRGPARSTSHHFGMLTLALEEDVRGPEMPPLEVFHVVLFGRCHFAKAGRGGAGRRCGRDRRGGVQPLLLVDGGRGRRLLKCLHRCLRVVHIRSRRDINLRAKPTTATAAAARHGWAGRVPIGLLEHYFEGAVERKPQERPMIFEEPGAFHHLEVHLEILSGVGRSSRRVSVGRGRQGWQRRAPSAYRTQFCKWSNFLTKLCFFF